jgi:hypothetical protein
MHMEPWAEESRNVRLVGHSDLNGWGDAFQIQVRDGLCYIAGSGEKGHDGLTILDVRDPRTPRVVNQLDGSPAARSHKVLLIDEQVMIINSELRPGRSEAGIVGGLKVYDISDPVAPKFVRYVETDSVGIHRPIYDAKRNLLYSSGFREGFEGKVLLVHDMADPFTPALIGVGWVPGQHVAGGEQPSWDAGKIGMGCWLHEANPYGNLVTCGFWDGGIALFDLTDPANPEFIWRQNPHESHGWPGAYHSFLVPDGSQFGIVATETISNACAKPPAFVTFYDMRGDGEPQLAGSFMPYEIDPVSMKPLDPRWCSTGTRYGAHNFWLGMGADDLLCVVWFAAGLRIVDWSDPFNPKEVGYYLPAGTPECPCPQSNDVFVDRATGLIYVSDRAGLGLHILEYTG